MIEKIKYDQVYDEGDIGNFIRTEEDLLAEGEEEGDDVYIEDHKEGGLS